MAKKRNPLEDPPTASSSDDDEMETSGGESEEVSSSDDEETKDPAVKPPSSAVTIAVPGKPTVSAAAVPSAAKEASDSESGSETETDSDEETERQSNPPPNQGSVKSLAVTTVPAASSAAKPKKKEAEASSAALALPAAKSGTKRPSEASSREANSKRAKKVTSGDDEKKIGEDSKKPAFQRLWTEDDEIAILQGMIDFKADTGKSPYEDTTAYYDFIKGSISFEVSKSQFMDKLRSLKKKYMNKEKPSFTKPHDQKSHKLCKYIWGSDGLALESAVKSNGVSKKSSQKKTKKLDSVKQELVFASPNGKQKAVEDDGNSKKVVVHGGDDVVSLAVAVKKPDWFENSFLVRAIAGFGVDESYVKQRWSLVPVETKKKIEEKVKVLQGKEFEFVLGKTEFLHEVTSMIAEATKNKPLDI
uniref:Mediator-associated protein 1 n=1 Tax=Noccaea caerulescens TaxID=107243 RepID=A0A1J3EGF8_NOCCA